MKIVDPANLSFNPEAFDSCSFFQHFEKFLGNTPYPKIAVAVSGGVDSLSLSLLLKDWAQPHDVQIIGLTVDHGLREESGEEANQVAEWFGNRGIPHRILNWKPLKGKIPHEVARDARYDLLLEWCRTHNVPYLCTAHHREDVAETVLMRFINGSGINGLSGIAPIVKTPDVQVLRPLLDLSKDMLKAYLKSKDQPWIEDPSNAQSKYKRARIREFMALEGLSPERLIAISKKMARARDFFETEVNHWLKENAEASEAGFYLVSSWEKFNMLHQELKCRVMEALLMRVGGSLYPPRSEDLCALVNHMVEGFRGKTLNGCLISSYRGKILISREEQAIEPEKILVPAQFNHWDNRFKINVGLHNLTVSKLGSENWSKIREDIDPDLGEKFPAVVKPTLPAIYKENQLVAVPHLGYNPKNLKLDMGFLPKLDLFIPKFTIA